MDRQMTETQTYAHTDRVREGAETERDRERETKRRIERTLEPLTHNYMKVHSLVLLLHSVCVCVCLSVQSLSQCVCVCTLSLPVQESPV